MLHKCQELQAPQASAVSTLCDVLSQLHALQAEAPVSGKKRKRVAADHLAFVVKAWLLQSHDGSVLAIDW